MSDTRKKLSKKSKIIISVSVVAVLIAAFSAVFLVMTSDDSYNFYNKMLLALAPDSITDKGQTFYIKQNPDYSQTESPNESMFICYYKDADGNEIDLPGGIYTTEDGTKSMVIVGFLGKAAEKIAAFRTVMNIIIVLIVLAFICFLIYLWYRHDLRRNEAEKRRRFGDKRYKQK